MRLAERNLSPRLRRKTDEEDVGATVLRTVIRQAREGRITIEESEDFWRLLVAITLNKVRKKARYWSAEKRNISREIELSPSGPQLADLALDDQHLQGEPSEEESTALVEMLEKLDQKLDPKCQEVLAYKLEGLNHVQIAERMDVSTRSVTRYVEKIQELLKSDSLD